MARGRKSEGGNVPRIGIHGLNDDDGLWYPFGIEEGLIVQTYIDKKVHDGLVYAAHVWNATIADDGTLIMASPVPIGIASHFTFVGSCGGDAWLDLIEDTAYDDGVPIVARNMNRNYPDSDFLQDPTLVGGNILTRMLLAGGSGPHASGGSATSRPEYHWVTIPTSPYAVRLTNISGGAQPGSINVNFYQ